MAVLNDKKDSLSDLHFNEMNYPFGLVNASIRTAALGLLPQYSNLTSIFGLSNSIFQDFNYTTKFTENLVSNLMPKSYLQEAFSTSLLANISSMTHSLNSISSYVENNSLSRLFSSLNNNPFTSLLDLSIGYPPHHAPEVKTYEKDLAEYSNLPVAIVNFPKAKKIKTLISSPTGIKLLENGNFMYKGRIIKKLRSEYKTGKLLALFLSREPHIITHEQIIKRLKIEDGEMYAYQFSHILKNLKKIFINNGILIDIENQRRKGYILHSVKPLSN